MTNRRWWETLPGVVLIALGFLLLMDTLGFLNAGRALAILWPLLVIAVGLLLLWGAGRWRKFGGPSGGPVGDIRIGEGEWDLRDMDTSIGVGELRLDLSRARIPEGETSLRVKGGIGKIEIRVPASLPISAQGRVAVGSLNLLGNKAEGISRQLCFTSSDYAIADKKVKVDMSLFMGEASIVRVG